MIEAEDGAEFVDLRNMGRVRRMLYHYRLLRRNRVGIPGAIRLALKYERPMKGRCV